MNDSQYYKRTVVKETIDSVHLHGQRSLRIFLPPGYNELLTYPVVYAQDGEDFFNYGRAATSAMQLILDEGVEPFIIVGIDVDKAVRSREYDAGGDLFAGYCRFVAEELLPFIEQRYAVRSSADYRVLAGDSLGGAVSLMLAVNYPQLFDKVISLSGAFYRDAMQLVRNADDLSALEIYMVVGLQEESVETASGVHDFVQINREMKEMLEARQAHVIYAERPGDHLWGFWQGEIPAAVRHFFSPSFL